MTTTLDLEIQQGAAFRQDFQWLHTDGSPVNITGITLRSKAKPFYASSQTFWDLSSSSGITVTSTTLGTFRITFLGTETAAFKPGTYLYDIEADEGGGYVTRLFEGSIVVDREVTV